MIKIFRYGEISNEDIFARKSPMADVESTVAGIIKAVREKGDAALYEFSLRFDKVVLESFMVSDEEM